MVVTDISKFDAYYVNLLTYKIKNSKTQYDLDMINTSEYFKGSRYHDDERIARMIVGIIYAECNCDAVAANAKLISLSSTDMDPYVKAAVLDSASADYYYAFEKQW